MSDQKHVQGTTVIKDSGFRRVFASGANRDRADGKGAFAWLPYQALLEIAQIFETGGLKYTPNNWRLGMPLSEYVNSAFRHLGKAAEGWDDENHIAMAGWNVMCFIATRHMIKLGHLPAELNDISNFYSAEGIAQAFTDIKAQNAAKLAERAQAGASTVVQAFGETAGKSAETLVNSLQQAATAADLLQPLPGSVGTVNPFEISSHDTFFATQALPPEPSAFARELLKLKPNWTRDEIQKSTLDQTDKDFLIREVSAKIEQRASVVQMSNAFPATSAKGEIGALLDGIMHWASLAPGDEVGEVVEALTEGMVDGVPVGEPGHVTILREGLKKTLEHQAKAAAAKQSPTGKAIIAALTPVKKKSSKKVVRTGLKSRQR